MPNLRNLFLPAFVFTIHSPLDLDTARSKIENSIQPKRSIWKKIIGSAEREFEGTFSNDRIEITRIIRYRNSFLPVITGALEWTGETTQLTLCTALHPAVKVIMALWFLGLFGWFGAHIADLLFEKGGLSLALLFPIGVIAFMLLVVQLSNRFEVKKATKYFTELLQGSIQSRN